MPAQLYKIDKGHTLPMKLMAMSAQTVATDILNCKNGVIKTSH